MPNQSPKPLPVLLAMSPAPVVEPTPSPSPSSSPAPPSQPSSIISPNSQPSPSPIPRRGSPSPQAPLVHRPYVPHPDPSAPNPKLRLHVQDVTHPGAAIFFQNTNPSTILSAALSAVISTLYTKSSRCRVHIPPTRSVTLVLRPMDGVAYTVGSSLDDDHKEIHFSLKYIAGIACARQTDEIRGVLVHEMVHCWQWNGHGSAPPGLIEGIADFVRLKAGLVPPHWKPEGGGDWDAGYQHTGYFLDWLERRYGKGAVQRINERLRTGKYCEGEFWEGLFDRGVKELWNDYCKSFRRHDDEEKEEGGSEKVEEGLEQVEADTDGEHEHKESVDTDGEHEHKKPIDTDSEHEQKEPIAPKHAPVNGQEQTQSREPERPDEKLDDEDGEIVELDSDVEEPKKK